MDSYIGLNRFHHQVNYSDGSLKYDDISYQKDDTHAYTFVYQNNQVFFEENEKGGGEGGGG
jgi:hypothetical protein